MKKTLMFKGSDDADMLQKIGAFRQIAWRRLIDPETAARRFSIDQFDRDGWHIVYLDDDLIIACGRLIIANDKPGVPDPCSFGPYIDRMNFPAGIMNRLVVHWDHGGTGVGRQLNLDRVDLARKQGASEIWVEIQDGRIPSMERIGFKDMGPSQDKSIEGVWRIMRKND